ncbi:MAG: sigma-54-dependent Fis family transcriptional regulator, partial [Candidatus Omnitrophica bacterium]|nr:sigma-54-dependent Fis family transcriptional regulator [Candidatus Omnitrophota bacterium]
LVLGESGTGKELLARRIHAASPRNGGPFVAVNCGALPHDLLESELFGHVRGAFTGADKDREGLILQADGGALFLDEVGELPLSLQKAFLRVLQAHRFRPVGAEREVESHFQLIAATNRDLDELVEVGHFRKDLLFRLRTTVIHLPPLRDRPEDIEGLSRHYLRQICDRRGIPSKAIGDDFLAALLTYRWPGNVRELIAVLERSLIVSEAAQTLHFQHLPQSLRICIRKSTIRQPLNGQITDLPTAPPAPHFPTWEQVRCECEGRYLRDLLSFCEGDIQRACRASAISRSRLYALFRKHALLPRRTVSTW